jgi:hypothetical protein
VEPEMRTITRQVGVAVHEAALTTAVMLQPHEVLDTGKPDVTAVILQEVELGIGRPDLLVLDVDLKTLAARRVAGLRLRTLAEARALGAWRSGDPSSAGLSSQHFLRLVARLEDQGWLDMSNDSRVVQHSVLVEAKVSHWARGLQQLARVRWAAHSAALLVPESIAENVSGVMLELNGLGLLTEQGGELSWRRQSPHAPLPTHVDAWLAELAIRALEPS